jgi:non-canonical purine NTP pyrophosphatase (RdgB/HAM1 family)
LADTQGKTLTLLLASGNEGKLREFRVLAAGHALTLDLFRNFRDLPEFPESAPTFAENAAGKAIYYSRHTNQMVIADDSGLAVDTLGGAPGVLSARYGGPGASDEQKNTKLLQELQGKRDLERAARFVCVIAVALRGRIRVVVSGQTEGIILDERRGGGGFGYDPVFYSPLLGKTFAELTAEEKNLHSHRGKAFRRMMEALE